MKHASTNQQAIDVEIPHILFEPKLKDVLRSFVKTQDIAVLDIYFLCRNILEIIQFCTLAPEDVLFLHAFPKLESLFKLAMDGILSMSIFRKVAASASLAVKKKSATRQGSSSVSLFASGDNGESENGGGGNNGSSSSSQEEFFRIKQHYTRILTDHEEQMSSNNNGSGDDFIKSILLSANNTAAVGELASKLGSNTFLNNHNNDDDCGSVTSSSTASAALMTARDGRNSTRSNNISKPTVEGLSLDLKFRFCFHIQRFLEWSDGIVNGLSEAREMEAHMGRVSSIRIN